VVYLIHGDNLLESFESLKNTTAGKDCTVFGGKNFNGADFKMAAKSLSLFGEAPCLVVKDFLKDKPDSKIVKDILDFLETNHLVYNLIIFYESHKVDLKAPLFQWILKNGKILFFPQPNKPQLKKWILERLQAENFSIENEALEMLAEGYKNDLWGLKNELQKLVLYRLDEKKINQDDLDRLSFPNEEKSIFELGDALGYRNAQRSLKVLAGLVDRGVSLGYITLMVARQLRLLIMTKILGLEGKKIVEIQKRLGLPPFVVQRLYQEAGSFSLDELKSAFSTLILNDAAIKKGKRLPRLSLDLWVDQLCFRSSGRG